MAKQAVNEFVGDHPDTLYGSGDKANTADKPKPIVESKNLELDSGETADMYSSIGFENGEKYETADSDKEEKYLLAEESPATALTQDDMSIPKWPTYSQPVEQKKEIEKELSQVRAMNKKFRAKLEQDTKDS